MSCPGTRIFIPHRPTGPRVNKKKKKTEGEEKEEKDGTCDQVHRYEHCTERGQLGEDVVDLVVGVCHLDRDLGEVVGVRAGEDFFIVVQVLGHRDQVVLVMCRVCARSKNKHAGLDGLPGCQTDRDPGTRHRGQHSPTAHSQSEKTHDIRRRGHPPVLIASFRQALDNVRLVPHQSQQPHHLLPTRPDPA